MVLITVETKHLSSASLVGGRLRVTRRYPARLYKTVLLRRVSTGGRTAARCPAKIKLTQ